jgi:hypothetical protein
MIGVADQVTERGGFAARMFDHRAEITMNVGRVGSAAPAPE